MTNGSHPPKKSAPPSTKKEKRPKPRQGKAAAPAPSRLAKLMGGTA
jgi:hypothetical protein